MTEIDRRTVRIALADREGTGLVTRFAAAGQRLIFDGDDTLWENNVHFERAIDDFIAWLGHATLAPTEVRAILDEIERANVAVHGYGSAAFGHSLRECAVRLRNQDLDQAEREVVLGFAERILSHSMEVITGVEETLADLSSRHELALLTKGQDEEQRLKIDRSGLGSLFTHRLVVPEKDAGVYRAVLAELGSTLESTWMIGNAPKSDINPALAAGLNAVFIPHDRTWSLEHQELDPVPVGQHRLTLERFADLARHF